MIHKAIAISLMFCSVAAANPIAIFSQEDSTDFPTTIKIEPNYVSSQPLFAMAAFGAKNQRAFWMILDKTDPDSKVYNRLLVDLNFNGDLTESKEVFSLLDGEGKTRKTIELPDVIVSDHSKFTNVTVVIENPANGECMFRATWNNKIHFAGGYSNGTNASTMCFANKKTEKPIVCFKGNAPFEFQPWSSHPLKIGRHNNFDVILGHKGQGYSSFCSSLGHILPEREPVLTTLHYVDNKGRQKRLSGKLSNRC
jgi:hypothetical protein